MIGSIVIITLAIGIAVPFWLWIDKQEGMY